MRFETKIGLGHEALTSAALFWTHVEVLERVATRKVNTKGFSLVPRGAGNDTVQALPKRRDLRVAGAKGLNHLLGFVHFDVGVAGVAVGPHAIPASERLVFDFRVSLNTDLLFESARLTRPSHTLLLFN